MMMLGDLLRLFDPMSLAIVVGGSLGTAALRSTFRDLGRAGAAIRPMLKADPARDALEAQRTLRQIGALVERKGIPCVDQAPTEHKFMREAAIKLADAPSADAFAAWLDESLLARDLRHRDVINVWRAAGDAAPTMGMIGTVLGLVGMFASMGSPEQLGPAMALAMLTTLYGLLLGGVVFGPLADRLQRLSEAELAWQRAIGHQLERLARDESLSTETWLRRYRKIKG